MSETTEPTIYDLNSTQRDLLTAAAKLDSPNGREIRTEYLDQTGTDPHPGKLYPNLNRLANKEFIEKQNLDGRENVYEITDAGLDALQELLENRIRALEITEGESLRV